MEVLPSLPYAKNLTKVSGQMSSLETKPSNICIKKETIIFTQWTRFPQPSEILWNRLSSNLEPSF